MRSRVTLRTLMVWVVLAALTFTGLREVYRARELSRVYAESLAHRRAAEVRLARTQDVLSARLGSQATEFDRLKAENAALKQRVAALEAGARAGVKEGGQ